MALARQLTSSASLKSKGAPSKRSALAQWPVSPRESVNPPPTLQAIAEQYEVDQSASPGSGPDVVVRQEVTIINELSLHARPAAEFVLAAKAFRSQVWLVKGEERFSAANILEVLCANPQLRRHAGYLQTVPFRTPKVRRRVDFVPWSR